LCAQETAIADAINNNTIPPLEFMEDVESLNQSKLWKGWIFGLNFGITKFQGDVTQYNQYELKPAFSLNIEKKINPLYSLSTELLIGEFSGLRKIEEYSGFSVFDPWGNYEGNGDKFITSFAEADLILNINLSNVMSYFRKNYRSDKFYFSAKLGVGINIFNSIRTNLDTDTYIYSYGYISDGPNSIGINSGAEKKSFFDQTKETVYIYGLRLNYKLKPRIELHLDYTIRNAITDKLDASVMITQYRNDNFAFLSIGASYKIGNYDFNNTWTSPIDILKDNVSVLDVKIEGFTDDSDNDGVADAFDKDSSTPLGVAVDGSGNALDVDMDNVPDYRDIDPFSNRGAIVDENGIELDDDQDGIPNSNDLESKTNIGAIVNQFGMDVGSKSFANGTGVIYFPSIYFNSGSSLVAVSNENRIATMARLLKNNQHIKLNVIGHTDNVGSKKFNKELGLKRAYAVINYLVLNYNIAADRFFAETDGEDNPLSTVNSVISEDESLLTLPIYKINRRVDFEISD
jgi:outer membrane protein OmpA-like peptidoglycan-associated protein